ncbi:MAG TPA: hypothetical protein PLK82_10215 [Bacteroidales bacterium]|nr:hypothetical protein [Bacteroidales bacterium]
MKEQRRPTRSRGYTAYRKIRYLARTGSLFRPGNSSVIASDGLTRSGYLVIALNSLVYFLIAYLLVYTLNLFVMGYAAMLFNIPAILYYYDVDYLIRSIDWSPDSVMGVFSSGPIVMFVLTLFLLILYKSVETEKGILRLLVLWMIFHTLTRILGEILAGAILGKGFGFVILYIFLMDTGKVVLTILSLAAMYYIGTRMTRISLFTANTYFNNLIGRQKSKFVLYQFLVPFILGDLIILMVKMPIFNSFDMSVNAAMLLLLLPLLIRSYRIEDMYFDEEKRRIGIRMVAAITLVVMITAFRVLFGTGIRL